LWGYIDGFGTPAGGVAFDGAFTLSYRVEASERLFKCFKIGFIPAFATTLFLDSLRIVKHWNGLFSVVDEV
jgi:hypothetical protein